MTRSIVALFLLLASGGPLFAADADVSLSFRCGEIRLPSLAAVGAVTGIDNAGARYEARERLLHQAERLCKAPSVAEVRFVPESRVAVQPLRALAAR